MVLKQERIPQQSPLKIPVIWVVIIGLVVIATIFATLFFSRSGREEGLVAGTENLRPVAGTENLQLVNPNWDKQKPVTAPVVVPAIRSDFKAEYKITGPAAKEIEFKFITPDRSNVVTYEVIVKTDKPLQITMSEEYKDSSGKIIYSYKSDPLIEQGKAGEKIFGGNIETKTDERAHKLLISLEVNYSTTTPKPWSPIAEPR